MMTKLSKPESVVKALLAERFNVPPIWVSFSNPAKLLRLVLSILKLPAILVMFDRPARLLMFLARRVRLCVNRLQLG